MQIEDNVSALIYKVQVESCVHTIVIPIDKLQTLGLTKSLIHYGIIKPKTLYKIVSVEVSHTLGTYTTDKVLAQSLLEKNRRLSRSLEIAEMNPSKLPYVYLPALYLVVLSVLLVTYLLVPQLVLAGTLFTLTVSGAYYLLFWAPVRSDSLIGRLFRRGRYLKSLRALMQGLDMTNIEDFIVRFPSECYQKLGAEYKRRYDLLVSSRRVS